MYYSTLNNDTCPTHPKYVALEWFTILQANGNYLTIVLVRAAIRKLNYIIAVQSPFDKDAINYFQCLAIISYR